MKKALFIGLGSIGQRHLRNLRKIAGDSIEVIAYRSKRNVPVLSDKMQVIDGAKLSDLYNVREFDDLDQALKEKPNMVFVTNPTSLHIPVAIKAVEAGCHLFMEKPISHNWKGIEELVNLVQRKNLVALVGYQFRFHPVLNQVSKWLDQKRIGRLISAHLFLGEYLPGWHPYEDYRQTHPARKELGGGVLVTQIHEFDYAFWLFGMPQKIYAVGGHLSHLEVDVEDCVTVLMHCHNEGRPLPVSLEMDYLQSPPVRGCNIIGDEGRIDWNFHKNEATLTNRQSGETDNCHFNKLERNDYFIKLLEHFLEAIEGKVKPKIDLTEGTKSLRMALAARESMETGQLVSLST